MFGDIMTYIPQPKDRGIMFKDIITSGFVDRDKSLCLLEGYYTKKPALDFDKYEKRYRMGMMQIIYESSKESRLPNKIEMCRLQGFPDNYTNIAWRGKPESPDSLRYKAMGNSMAVPCMKWIGERIEMVEKGML
jgi:hypothetical protein